MRNPGHVGVLLPVSPVGIHEVMSSAQPAGDSASSRVPSRLHAVHVGGAKKISCFPGASMLEISMGTSDLVNIELRHSGNPDLR